MPIEYEMKYLKTMVECVIVKYATIHLLPDPDCFLPLNDKYNIASNTILNLSEHNNLLTKIVNIDEKNAVYALKKRGYWVSWINNHYDETNSSLVSLKKNMWVSGKDE